jgi:uncharacterized protein
LARQDVPEDFAGFVRSEHFPCVGAKAALALGHLSTFEAGNIALPYCDAAIHAALVDFGEAVEEAKPLMQSFACLFRSGPIVSDAQFEAALWARLQALHDIDVRACVNWAANVSSDPRSPHFSMSIAGVAYFVVGLHPGATRASRRFSRPALIFNPHVQFEQLRADGRYGVMQTIVRERELQAGQGVNPMLSEFGDRGEAPQYSGRRVEADWVCPLKVRTTAPEKVSA